MMNENERYRAWVTRRAAEEAPEGFVARVMSALPATGDEQDEMSAPLLAVMCVAAGLVLCLRVFATFAVFIQ